MSTPEAYLLLLNRAHTETWTVNGTVRVTGMQEKSGASLLRG